MQIRFYRNRPMGATLCSFRSRARHGFFFLQIHYSDDLHVSSIPCSLSNKFPLLIVFVIISSYFYSLGTKNRLSLLYLFSVLISINIIIFIMYSIIISDYFIFSILFRANNPTLTNTIICVILRRR